MAASRRLKTVITAGLAIISLGLSGVPSQARPVTAGPEDGPTGKRVDFLPDPGVGIRYEDDAGNVCVAEVLPQTGKNGDLVRIKRDGRAFVLIAEQPAYLRITFADGRRYHGLGELNANVWVDPPNGKPRVFMAVSVARVSDGTSMRLGQCRGLVDSDGVAKVLSIVVE